MIIKPRLNQFQASWLEKYEKKKTALKAADQKASDLKVEVKELKKEIEGLKIASEVPSAGVSKSASITVPHLNLAATHPVVHSIGTPTGTAANLLSANEIPQSSDGDSIGDGYASCGAEEFSPPAAPPGLAPVPSFPLAPATPVQAAPTGPGWSSPSPSMGCLLYTSPSPRD